MLESKQDHCIFCFDTILAKLNNSMLPKYPQHLDKFSCPLFVTWKKKDDLRGCIGTFASKSIDQNLSNYAIVSAFQDSRFSPININELPQLSVYVSLLVDFQNGKDAYDWTIGVHGIIIDFVENDNNYNGTFLPEVMVEQNWTKDETLKQLIRKTGYNKNWKNVVQNIQLQKYKSSKNNLSFQEFQKLKQAK